MIFIHNFIDKKWALHECTWIHLWSFFYENEAEGKGRTNILIARIFNWIRSDPQILPKFFSREFCWGEGRWGWGKKAILLCMWIFLSNFFANHLLRRRRKRLYFMQWYIYIFFHENNTKLYCFFSRKLSSLMSKYILVNCKGMGRGKELREIFFPSSKHWVSKL